MSEPENTSEADQFDPTDPNLPREKPRGKGFPQILHDRARDAGTRLHSLLVSLATGALGVFFIALTTKVDPPITSDERISVLAALGLMALSLGTGILNWKADCRRNFFWASALQVRDQAEKDRFYERRDYWLSVERQSATVQWVSFLLGVGATVVYLTLRIVG